MSTLFVKVKNRCNTSSVIGKRTSFCIAKSRNNIDYWNFCKTLMQWLKYLATRKKKKILHLQLHSAKGLGSSHGIQSSWWWVWFFSGIELIFITVGTKLWIVQKTGSIAQGRFHHCWTALAQVLTPIGREEAGGAQRAVRWQSQDSQSSLPKGMFPTIWHHAQHMELGEKGGRRDIWREGAPKSPLKVMEPCSVGHACPWEGVNESLALFCLHLQHLLDILNCLYLYPQDFSLLPFWFFLLPHLRILSEGLCEA